MDPRNLAARLPSDERDALLALVCAGDHETFLLETAERLRRHHLVEVLPDGPMDLTRLGRVCKGGFRTANRSKRSVGE